MHPAECEFGGSAPIPSSAMASATLAPVPAVVATATTPATGVLGAGASATALYFFQVTGPTEGELVPLLMDVFLRTESSFDANAIARLIVSTTSGVFQGFEVCSDGTCEQAEMAETISLQVRTGSTGDSLTLFAQAQAFVTRANTETALAVADPFIYVDPRFPDVELYHVSVSPGVGNASIRTVPVPATVYLLGAALCMLGRRARRRV